MKRDFLKGLGIEDKELIDKILDENSADIGRAKGELETYKTKVSDLEKDVKDKDSKIAELEKSVGDTKALNDEIDKLKGEKTQLESDLNTKVTEIQKTHSIENKIRDEKGKNVKAIMALLDLDKITFENNQLGGIEDQLNTLKQAEDSAMLFGDSNSGNLAGTTPSNPIGNSGGTAPTTVTLTAAVAKALNK